MREQGVGAEFVGRLVGARCGAGAWPPIARVGRAEGGTMGTASSGSTAAVAGPRIAAAVSYSVTLGSVELVKVPV